MMPLMLCRDQGYELLPDSSTRLQANDRILFCGLDTAKDALILLVDNLKALTFIIDGKEIADSLIWRWLRKRLGNA